MIYQSMSRKWREEMLRGSFAKERSIRILEEYFLIVIEDFKTFASACCRGGMELCMVQFPSAGAGSCLQVRGVLITGCRAECALKWPKVSSRHPTRPITLRHSAPWTQARREGCGESHKSESFEGALAARGGQLLTCFLSKTSKTSNRPPPAPAILRFSENRNSSWCTEVGGR